MCEGGKSLSTQKGSLVVLQDYPEGHDKIQDKYKEEMFVVGSDPKSSICKIKPVDGVRLVHTVKKGEKQDLQRNCWKGEIFSSLEEMGVPNALSFNRKVKLKESAQEVTIMLPAQRIDICHRVIVLLLA